MARRINKDGAERDVPVENILEGDHLRVRLSESVPVDGVVLEGRSSLDESRISGEPVVIEKVEGDQLTGGTLNGNGSLVMRAERVAAAAMSLSSVSVIGNSLCLRNVDINSP